MGSRRPRGPDGEGPGRGSRNSGDRGPRIFISYRREDTSGYAGWLRDSLTRQFSVDQVFMDVDTIEPGLDFAEVINDAVGTCDILLALIGQEWLTATDAHGDRRLDKEDDYVRLEIGAALERHIRVIPVLLQDADMPGADQLPAELANLARRHALELSDARWEFDVQRLKTVIGKANVAKARWDAPPVRDRDRAAEREQVDEPARGRERYRPLVALGAAVGLALVALAVFWSGAIQGANDTGGSGRGKIATDPSVDGPFDTFEQVLVTSRVPGDLLPSCNSASRNEKPTHAVLAVSCAPDSGPADLVVYSAFHDGRTMKKWFAEEARDAELPESRATCENMIESSSGGLRDFWSTGQRTGDHNISGADEDDPYAGRVFCSQTDSRIVWIDYATKLAGVATNRRSSFRSLYQWWLSASGPTHPATFVGSIDDDGLTRLEKQLVWHIPKMIRSGCESDQSASPVIITSVCPEPANSGVDVVSYALFYDVNSLKQYYSSRRFENLDKSCAKIRGDSTWISNGIDGSHVLDKRRGLFHGRVFCYHDDDRVKIEWTDPSTKLYTVAKARDEQELSAWWEDTAGPRHPEEHPEDTMDDM